MLQVQRHILTTLLLSLALLLIPFDFISSSLLIYPAQFKLSIPLFNLPWIQNSCLLSFLFFSGLFFQAASLKRAKTLLITGLLIYALSSLFLVFNVTFSLIIGTRLTQGLSFAMLLPASLKLLHLSSAARAYYLWGFILVIGLFVSPLLSSWILSTFSLQMLFYTLSSYALLIALLSVFLLSFEKTTEDHPIDPKGFLLIGSSMVILILSLSMSLYWGWGVSSLFIFLSFLLFNLAFFFEKKSNFPLFETELLKDRSFLTSFVPLLFLQFVLWPILFFVPLYLQYLWGLPHLTTGFWLLIFTGAVVCGFLISQYTYKKGWVRYSVGIALLCLTTSLFLLSFVTEAGYRSYFLSILALLGFGWGFLFINIYSGGVGLFPKKLLTRGFAFYEIFPFLAGSLGLSIGVSLFVSKMSSAFYSALSNHNLTFPFSLNTHFFEILSRPDIYSEEIRNALSGAILKGFHSLTTFLSWMGFVCLIFSIIYIPSETKEVLSDSSEE
ncbi:MAG: hypothetical protein S4CHLAM7_01410 [Chlamydiae bacterium]|nr:hypothetical protein [Chlamydiota bacterium]